jgi:hypothetical protein
MLAMNLGESVLSGNTFILILTNIQNLAFFSAALESSIVKHYWKATERRCTWQN